MGKVLIWLGLGLATGLGASTSQAQTGLRALPAVWLAPRLGTSASHTLRVSADLGYGVMGAVASTGGAHHRARAGLGVGYQAPFGLALELRFDGRWDFHHVPGGDDSLVGEPRLYARYGHALGRRALLGVELAVWVPGASAPSLHFGATSLDLLAVSELALPKRLALVLALGPRFDRSAESVSSSVTLSRSDQLSLGVSSFRALLARLALEAALGSSHVALELSADTLLGSKAPSFGHSPLRAALAARQPFGDGFEGLLTVAVLLSARPALSADVYVPFEPRFQALVGARYSYGDKPARKSSAAEVVATAASPETVPVVPQPVLPPVAPATSELLVVVVSATGEALPDVQVVLEPGEALQSGGSGSARFSGVAPGEHIVSLHADGFVDQSVRVELLEAGTKELRVALEVARQVALLRVLVRDAESGAPVSAELTLSGLSASKATRVKASTNADGSFEHELPAGRYRVQLRAQGYQAQTRSIDVGERGVTLFNIDLSPEAR